MVESVKNNSRLLTIAIPTYNRAKYLDLCLSQIAKQVPPGDERIEIVVSDNLSTDNTEEIVAKYIRRGHPIRYIKNQKNIGGDPNIIQAYNLATTKYVLVFGDDDVFLDGSIQRMVDLIERDDFGVVFLRSFGFENDFDPTAARKQKYRLIEYHTKDYFVWRINYLFTFISANIINKQMVGPEGDTTQLGPNMAQLGWIFSAFSRARKNAVIDGHLFASKGDIPANYNLAEVFGVNTNRVFDLLAQKGIPKRFFFYYNLHLLVTFFPSRILAVREKPGHDRSHDFFATLFPLYRKNLLFWLFTVPIIKAPLPIARIWFRLIRMFFIYR